MYPCHVCLIHASIKRENNKSVSLGAESCVRVCTCACVRACARACVWASVCARALARTTTWWYNFELDVSSSRSIKIITLSQVVAWHDTSTRRVDPSACRIILYERAAVCRAGRADGVSEVFPSSPPPRAIWLFAFIFIRTPLGCGAADVWCRVEFRRDVFENSRQAIPATATATAAAAAAAWLGGWARRVPAMEIRRRRFSRPSRVELKRYFSSSFLLRTLRLISKSCQKPRRGETAEY